MHYPHYKGPLKITTTEAFVWPSAPFIFLRMLRGAFPGLGGREYFFDVYEDKS